MSKQKRPGCDCNTPGPHANRKGSHENKENIPQSKRSVKRRRGPARMDQEQVQKPGYWAVLPAAVRYDPQLPPSAKILYAEISALTDQRGFCFASNDYFRKLYGMSERTLQEQLRALKRRGYISISDGDGGAGRRKIYAGINPLQENPAENCGVTPQKTAGSNNNKKDNNNPPTSPPGGERGKRRRRKAACEWEPEIFERFWDAYPRGEDKSAARYEWDEIHADRKLMREMSAALERQKQSDEWRRGIGIPYACRWLRNRRWEDEIRDPEYPETTDNREDLPWI